MAITQKIMPDTDSHFRLTSCSCGGAAEYLGFDTGFWAVHCTVCGRRGKLQAIRHTAQIRWNQGGERNG